MDYQGVIVKIKVRILYFADCANVSARRRTTSLKGLTDDIIGIRMAILISLSHACNGFHFLRYSRNYQNFLGWFPE
jgi:hypothetical protein